MGSLSSIIKGAHCSVLRSVWYSSPFSPSKLFHFNVVFYFTYPVQFVKYIRIDAFLPNYLCLLDLLVRSTCLLKFLSFSHYALLISISLETVPNTHSSPYPFKYILIFNLSPLTRLGLCRTRRNDSWRVTSLPPFLYPARLDYNLREVT